MGGYCGGALIHPNVIISAAHCPEPAWILVGNNRRSSMDEGGHFIPDGCVAYEVHPDYDEDNSDNDVALCYLANPVEIDDDQVVLELNLDNDVPVVGEILRAIGMGRLVSGGPVPDVLQYADVPYVDNDTCNGPYMGRITDNMLCAGYPAGGVDSCQGDSGGPLVMVTPNDKGRDIHTYVGTVSWGYGCALPGYPGVYARTSSDEIKNFILGTVCDTWHLDASFCPSSGKNEKNTKRCKAESKQPLIVEIGTDIYAAYETYFYLEDSTGNVNDVELEFSNYESTLSTYLVCPGEEYTAYLGDTYGDGQIQVDVGNCPTCEIPHPIAAGYSGTGDTIFEVEDRDFGSSTTVGFTLTGSACDQIITVKIYTDSYPGETSWYIEDSSWTTIAMSTYYTDEFTLYSQDVSNLCPGDYTFVLLDSFGDGMVYWRLPTVGMAGYAADGTELFNAKGSWNGYKLSAPFTMP